MKVNLPRHDIKWAKPPNSKSKGTSPKRRHCEDSQKVVFALCICNPVPERFTLPENSTTIVNAEMEEITDESK